VYVCVCVCVCVCVPTYKRTSSRQRLFCFAATATPQKIQWNHLQPAFHNLLRHRDRQLKYVYQSSLYLYNQKQQRVLTHSLTHSHIHAVTHVPTDAMTHSHMVTCLPFLMLLHPDVRHIEDPPAVCDNR